MKDFDNHISFERWSEMMARDIYVYEEDKPRSLAKLFEMFGDDFEEDESTFAQADQKTSSRSTKAF
ncbi:MAG: hypothetical protein N3G78_01055 [Desulfobacterota bacterium]|nr:hypothetical protein [Thermodesulfobacteriota bacterium]